jgi:hypothetical protein
MRVYYRVVELKDEKLLPLFHRRKNPFPVGKWLKAEKKIVRDGSGNTYYLSGFHLFKTLEEAKNFWNSIKKENRVVVACHAKGVRKKEHSRKNIYLADEIKIWGVYSL